MTNTERPDNPQIVRTLQDSGAFAILGTSNKHLKIMFVKYDKHTDTRWLFINGTLVVESNGKNIAIGKTNPSFSNTNSVAFDFAVAQTNIVDKAKRFIKKALCNEGDKRRVNYSITIFGDFRNFKAKVTFIETA